MEFVPFWIALAVSALSFLIYYRKKLPEKKVQLIEGGFVTIDCQATGLIPGVDDLLQVAAVKYLDGKEVDRFSTFIRPNQDIPSKVTETTGIRLEDVTQAPWPQDGIRDLLRFTQGYPLVGHNVALDLRFIHLYAPHYQPPAFDTLAMSRRVHRDLKIHSLEEMKDQYNITSPSRDALGNALATGDLLFHLLGDTNPMGPEHRREVDPVDLSKHLKHCKLQEDQASFSPQDQSFIDVLRDMTSSPHLTFTKDENSLHVVYYKEIACIHYRDNKASLVLPNRSLDGVVTTLPSSPDAKAGTQAFSLTQAQDLTLFTPAFQSLIEAMDTEMALLSWEYIPATTEY